MPDTIAIITRRNPEACITIETHVGAAEERCVVHEDHRVAVDFWAKLAMPGKRRTASGDCNDGSWIHLFEDRRDEFSSGDWVANGLSVMVGTRTIAHLGVSGDYGPQRIHEAVNNAKLFADSKQLLRLVRDILPTVESGDAGTGWGPWIGRARMISDSLPSLD